MRLIDLVGTYTKGLAVGEREREREALGCVYDIANLAEDTGFWY